MQMNKEIFAQTDRLVLRKFNRNDYFNLCGILQVNPKIRTKTPTRSANAEINSILSDCLFQ